MKQARSLITSVTTAILLTLSLNSQAATLSADEQHFANLINEYRVANGKAPVAVTNIMTNIAQLHVYDLFTYQPHAPSACNLHSWSANGPWTPMCYTADHAEAQKMWDKPREISGGVYTGNGYELTAYGYTSAEAALEGFKNSAGHNDVLLNAGIWEPLGSWSAMGVGIHDRYYSIWFGHAIDPSGPVGAAVPEPGTYLLLLIGLVAVGLMQRNHRSAA